MQSLAQYRHVQPLDTDETYGVFDGQLVHMDKVNPMWMHRNNLNSYVACSFVGTVVGTALGELHQIRNFENPDFALVGMFIGILRATVPDYAKTVLCSNLHSFSSCCYLSFALDGSVSVISCSVCDLAGICTPWGVVLDGQWYILI